MQSNIVLTLTGTDRIGIVEEVTKLLFDLGGNVETSRMSRLGGEFAIILLVSIPADKLDCLEVVVRNLTAQGFKLTTCTTEKTYAETHPGWRSRRIEVHGADHEGIIHEIAQILYRQGISIESMETETSRAPETGVSLFAMNAHVIVPPNLRGKAWEAALISAGKSLNVDIRVTVVKQPAMA